jgi:hypothetical protein
MERDMYHREPKVEMNDLTVLRTSSLTGVIERELEHLILTGGVEAR